MKKINQLIFLLLTLSLSTSACAVKTQSFRGNQEFSNRSFEEMSVNGNTRFKNVQISTATISGDVLFDDIEVRRTLDVKGNIAGVKGNFYKLHAIGNTNLTNVRVEYLDITGPTILKNSVAPNVDIIGSLEATNSTLGTIRADTSSITLSESKAGTIRIKNDNNYTNQKLILNNSSAKEVIFESGNGQIYVIGNAEIIGRVIGATVIKE